MAPGTYKIRPTLVVQGGTPIFGGNHVPAGDVGAWFTDPDPPFAPPTPLIDVFGIAPDGIHDAIASVFATASPTGFNTVLRFSFFGLSIYLDGSLVPISFQSIPAGWTPLTATISLNPAPSVSQPGVGSAHYHLQFDSFHEGPEDTATFDFPAPVPSAINLINNGCGIRVDITVTAPPDSANIFFTPELVIDGTYDIVASSTVIPVIEDPDTPRFIGDKVIITSKLPGLDTITAIVLDFIDPILGPKQIIISRNPEDDFISMKINNDIFAWLDFIFILKPNTLGFYVPFGFKKFAGTVTLSIIGSAFSGTVVLGTLNIAFADGSGIYFINPARTSDKLYFRDGYFTTVRFIMLPGFPIISENDEENEDFYKLLQYPRRIMELAETLDDEENFDLNFTPVTNTTIDVSTEDVEIPSPYIKTGFLP